MPASPRGRPKPGYDTDIRLLRQLDTRLAASRAALPRRLDLRVLGVAAGAEQCDTRLLRERTGLSAPSVSDVLARLERAGMIARRRAGRSCVVKVLEPGWVALDLASRWREQAIALLRRDLKPSEREELRSLADLVARELA